MSASHSNDPKLAEALAECERLREENRQLRGRLGIPRMETPDPLPSVSDMQGAVTSKSTPDGKVKLFRNLFRGREDVHAVRWEGRNGKSGYSPAYHRIWGTSFRNAPDKPKEYFPLTDQVMVERLNQLVASTSSSRGNEAQTSKPGSQSLPTSAATKQLPADPALAFAQLATERLYGALVRCEERYPQTGSHSVLMIVVEREAAQWRETLKTVHRDCFDSHKTDPLAPVQLEVIDRATDDAIQRLIGARLFSKTTRATRPLF